MHVCLRFVVRVYQAQLVFLMFERDSQSQFTLYSSVSVLNKLISLGLNLTRVTRPYQVVTMTIYDLLLNFGSKAGHAIRKFFE